MVLFLASPSPDGDACTHVTLSSHAPPRTTRTRKPPRGIGRSRTPSKPCPERSRGNLPTVVSGDFHSSNAEGLGVTSVHAWSGAEVSRFPEKASTKNGGESPAIISNTCL
jgi:hypothetical protein